MSHRILNCCRIACVVGSIGLAPQLGCRQDQDKPPRQAILILLDAARPDHFSCYGYERTTTPEMDRLAAGGVVFRRHFAQATATRASVSSMMYSRYYCLPLFPNSPQVPYSNPASLFRSPDDAQMSFVKALEAAGFTTAAISAHLWTGEDTAFADEFMEMHDLTTRIRDRERPYPSAELMIDDTIDWIGKNKEKDYFLYLHLMDTHVPHHFDSDAQAFFGAPSYDASHFRSNGAPNVPDFELTEDDLRYANALYDGSLRYVDRHIGRLVDFLRRERLLDNTLIAVTADHGENLLRPGDKPRYGVSIFTHGGAWLEPVAKIPLILHFPPKLKPGVVDDFSEGLDLAPTVLSLLDVALPQGKAFDGVDLSAAIAGRIAPKKHVLARRGIRTAQYKCLFASPVKVLLGDPIPDPKDLNGRLYDLHADPAEMNNLFASKPDVVGNLLRRFRASLSDQFQRYEAARSSEQPRAAFAVSARHAKTDVPLPTATLRFLPDGWSRFKRGSHSFLVASNADEPLSIHFPLPNGTYNLSVGLQGRARVDVDGESRELAGNGEVEFGDVTVSDEVFRAIIRASGDGPVAIRLFGFVPATAPALDAEAAKERLDRLRALGYVD